MTAGRRRSVLWYLAAGYVWLLPYQFKMDRAFNFAPSDIFMLLVLLLAAGQLKYREEAWSIWHFAIPLVFVVGSLVAAMRFGTLARYEFLNKDAGLLIPFLTYATIVSAIASWDDLRSMLRIFVAAVVLENIAAVGGYLASYFFGMSTPFTSYGGLRLSGMLTDPNAYGGLLVVALVVAETASWGPSPLFGRPMLWIARATLAPGILFTFSRSAWVALAFALVLLVLVRARVVVRLLAACAIGIPVFLFGMGFSFLPIFQQMASRPKQVEGRFDLIDQALEAFSHHPLFGGGLGSFRLGAGEVAHNSAMWFLADFGVIGLIVLLGFMGWFFVKAWDAYQLAPERERPVTLALLAAHTAMFGLAMGIEALYQRQWWLVFGLIAAGCSMARGFTVIPRREIEVSAYAHS
jgi:O-antigen ligase